MGGGCGKRGQHGGHHGGEGAQQSCMNSDGGVYGLNGQVRVWHDGQGDKVLQHFYHVVHGGRHCLQETE